MCQNYRHELRDRLGLEWRDLAKPQRECMLSWKEHFGGHENVLRGRLRFARVHVVLTSALWWPRERHSAPDGHESEWLLAFDGHDFG